MKPLKESFIKAKDLDNLNKKKYILTNETIKRNIHTLHRIQALKDIPSKKVKKGDLGGWIESYDNLDQKGDCWIGDTAWVYDEAKVYGDAYVFGDALVGEDAEVFDNAKVYGDTIISGKAQIYGNAKVYGDSRVRGNAIIYGNAEVYGNAQVFNTAKVDYSINKGKINK